MVLSLPFICSTDHHLSSFLLATVHWISCSMMGIGWLLFICSGCFAAEERAPFTCMNVCIYECMYVCVCVCRYICMYVCLCLYMCVWVCMYVYVYVCMHVYINYICVCLLEWYLSYEVHVVLFCLN